MKSLAINGGEPVRRIPFPQHRTTGDEEKQAVARVMDSGALSKFIGADHPDFTGGPEVRALEEEWAEHFGTKHAIAVNSNSSGLICAMGAIGIQPGDEVIVCGYSMCISATAPLFYGGVPVFADLEPDYLCLDPHSVERCITPKTKAILIVDLFGQPYDSTAINALARQHSLYVVEDCAQAPGARNGEKMAGTLGHIGIFSLNYHKHIQCGEGGVIVSNDAELTERMNLIRNHAEAVVEGRKCGHYPNMLGFNFRMTEIEASIAREQLRKLDGLLKRRQENVRYLESQLDFIDGLQFSSARPGATHAYYQHALLWNSEAAGVGRNSFIQAVTAELPHFESRETEGVKLGYGYIKPLYRLPIFTSRTGPSRFTEALPDYSSTVCPVMEKLHHKTLVHHEFMLPCMRKQDMDDVCQAFYKVWQSRHYLQDLADTSKLERA